MAIKEGKRRGKNEIGDDFLWTANEIARFIGRTPRFVFHQQKNLGCTHIGGTLVASKKKLRALLSGETA